MLQRPLKLALVCFGVGFVLALIFGTTGPFGTAGLSVTNLLRLAGWLAATSWGWQDGRELLQGTRWSRIQMLLAATGYAGMALVVAYLAGAIPAYFHGG